MIKKTIWEEMTPEQREEYLRYFKEEYEYLPEWALRLHAPKKVSELPKEILEIMEAHPIIGKVMNAYPDEEQPEALIRYVNNLPWFIINTETQEDMINSLMEVGEAIMEGDYIGTIMERHTAPRGHAFSIHPKDFWEGVEHRRRADITLYVKSRRDRLRSYFLPIVEEALLLFFKEYKGADPRIGIRFLWEKAREYGLRKIDRPLSKKGGEALSSLAYEVLGLVEILSLNTDKVAYFDEIDNEDEVKSDAIYGSMIGEIITQLLPLITKFSECERAAICRSGKDYLQKINPEQILGEVAEHLTHQHRLYEALSSLLSDEAIEAAHSAKNFEELPPEIKGEWENAVRNLYDKK